MNRVPLLAALLLVSAAAVSAGAERKPGDVVIEPASLSAPGTGVIDYELGTLYVPENRADPRSRIIGVGFARFRPLKPTAAPPLFLLPGGPGNSFLTNLASLVSGVQRYRQVSDVVLVDQRGFSRRGDVLAFSKRRPEEPLDQPGSVARSTAATIQMARDAVAAFARQGIDLRGYTVKECADDVNDLRKALGYDRLTLVGTSFGSQWSFAIMRRHPEVVARALLSGVEPLDYGYDMPSHVVAALQRMWWEVERDPRFQPYLPAGGMMAAAREVLRRLDRTPAHVAVKDEKAGRDVTVCLGREDFQRDLLRGGPSFILSAYHEHYDSWARAVLARRRGQGPSVPPIGWLIDTSLGVTAKRAYLLRTDPGTELLGHWNFDAYMATAGIWPSPDVGDDFRTEVVSRIPVVFAQGDWDTQTPVENVLNIAPFSPNGRVLLAVNGGHGVLGPIARSHPAVMAVLLDFLRTGDTVNVPARLTLPVPKFEVPDFPPPGAAGR
jgi:pimeloyl-ACP methyl ester carboxylesterase